MNDAPAIAEAPPPGAKAIAELAEQLNQLLRLRTFPIGMKLFEDLDAMANVPGLRRPPKGKTFSTCQLVTQARMAGFTLGIVGALVGAAISTAALWLHLFWLLCLGTLVAGAADAVLQVIGLKEDGQPQGIVQRVSVPGHVLTPPILLGSVAASSSSLSVIW